MEKPRELYGDERLPTPNALLEELRRRFWIVGFCALAGLGLGLLMFLVTPKAYQAKGTFLINELPFSVGTLDGETDRQLVQSLILSIPSEEMRRAIAADLQVPDVNLAFTDHDKPVSFVGGGNTKANIEVTATRNSRLGLISVESPDPEFATRVVRTLFHEVENLNKIAGSMSAIQSRLKLDHSESEKLVDELGTASSDRIKFEQQNRALDDFLNRKLPLETFPAFAQDDTLNNIKTQMMLTTSEYDGLAAQSSLGGRLASKRAELEGLRSQVSTHLDGLVAGLRTSFEIAETREKGLRAAVDDLQQKMTALETLQAELSKGFGDYQERSEMIAKIDSNMVSEQSVIVVIDPGYAIKKAIRPSLVIDVGLGLFMGAGLGFGLILILLQLRPRRA